MAFSDEMIISNRHATTGGKYSLAWLNLLGNFFIIVRFDFLRLSFQFVYQTNKVSAISIFWNGNAAVGCDPFANCFRSNLRWV